MIMIKYTTGIFKFKFSLKFQVARSSLSRLDHASRAADTSRYLCAVNSGLP